MLFLRYYQSEMYFLMIFSAIYQHSLSTHSVIQPQHPAPPPQLWGNDRAIYDSNDPLFKKWGMRAAPPYHKPAYRPPPPEYQIPPCWLFLEQMKEEKLIIAPQVNLPPPILPKFAVKQL